MLILMNAREKQYKIDRADFKRVMTPEVLDNVLHRLVTSMKLEPQNETVYKSRYRKALLTKPDSALRVSIRMNVECELNRLAVLEFAPYSIPKLR